MTSKSINAKNIVLTIITLFSVFASAQNQKNDLQKVNLYGKVKSIREISYQAVEKNGNIEKENIISDKIISFNEKGYTAEIILHYFAPEPLILSKTIFKYNLQDVLIEEDEYDSDGNFFEKTKYLYDEKNNVIAIEWFNSEGKFKSKYIYKYDENGNEIERWYHYHTEKPFLVNRFQYDAHNRLIEFRKYVEGGKLEEITTYQYDKNGRNTKIHSFLPNGKWTDTITYLYDENGKEIGYVYKEKWKRKIIYIYTYEFDSHSNWIKKIEYKNNRPRTITERRIEYY